MSTNTDGTLSLEELGERGSALYEQIKNELEPAYKNQFVAIHVASGDYTVAPSTAKAMRTMRALHEQGQLFLRKIGSEPEYGLAARLLEGEMFAAGQRSK